MSVLEHAVAEPANVNHAAQGAVDNNKIIFSSHDIRKIRPVSVNGKRYSFIGSCVATCCLWLSNVADRKPMRMTKPDHVVATLLQLKYLRCSADERVCGLLAEMGLDGTKAERPQRGGDALRAIAAGGDGMYLLAIKGDTGETVSMPHTVAFLRRGGMLYFLDPSHGLFEYGPLQGRLMERQFAAFGYDRAEVTLWSVAAWDCDADREAPALAG